ncbi:hypothetical protein ALTERO38_51888 [Alteromonas sp. 38]|nr:hypothetical protein ALTER154_80438 [Alteromonas sp. 154]VXB91138.1 hypothetical protein ALTERO38_51888 [Alteromonas sp. 38]
MRSQSGKKSCIGVGFEEANHASYFKALICYPLTTVWRRYPDGSGPTGTF